MEILNWLEDEGTTTANYLAFLLLYAEEKKRVEGKERNSYIETLKIITYFTILLCLHLGVTKMD